MTDAASTTALRGTLVQDGTTIPDAVLTIVDGRVSWVGPAAQSPVPAPDPTPGTVLVPGLVDLHCHGGGGHGFPEADAAGVATAAAHHRAHGTTTLIGSLVSAPPAVLRERLVVLGAAVDAGHLAGVHLEGPFLSALRCGAQDPAALLPGDPGLLADLLDGPGSAVRAMTMAPETAHAHDLVALLCERGVVPSFGHTDAPIDVLRSAVDRVVAAGRRAGATHLFNGMAPVHHRAPGAVAGCLAAAARGDLVVEVIGDGVHLADATVGVLFDLLGPRRIALVTDAMAAAGMPDGDYPLGPLRVAVRSGVARLATPDGVPGAIAGGTAVLLDVVRRAVHLAGVPLVDAVTAATATPADLYGFDAGRLVAGVSADVLELDAGLHPCRVWHRGVPVGQGVTPCQS